MEEHRVAIAHVREQIIAIVRGAPLWPGDTISHAAANECGRRGWARRDEDGCWVPTPLGIQEALASGAAPEGS